MSPLSFGLQKIDYGSVRTLVEGFDSLGEDAKA